ncbi:uncharacterized protein LOC144281782 [Canis aureus]
MKQCARIRFLTAVADMGSVFQDEQPRVPSPEGCDLPDTLYLAPRGKQLLNLKFRPEEGGATFQLFRGGVHAHRHNCSPWRSWVVSRRCQREGLWRLQPDCSGDRDGVASGRERCRWFPK